MIGKLFGRNGHHREYCMNTRLVIGSHSVLSIRKKKCLSLAVLRVISFIVLENQGIVRKRIGKSLPIAQSIFVPFLISK